MNKEQLVFPLATTEDISSILEMMKAFYAIDNYPFDREASQKNLSTFLRNQHFGKVWLILVDNQVIGYLILTFGFSFEYQGRDAFLDELYIKENFRSKGIGQQAIEFLLQSAKKLEVKAIHLEVEVQNEKGQKLYKRNGFKGNCRVLLTKRIE